MQNMEIWEILWKIEQIHWILWPETKWQIGGAHRMAVSQHFVSEMECTQSKISTWDIYLSNFYQLFPVHDQMKAVEGRKEKFACFKGTVDPTNYDKKSDEGSNSVRMRPENSGASKVVQKWLSTIVSEPSDAQLSDYV